MSAAILAGALPDLRRRLWRHLSLRRQRQFVMLMGLMVISAFAEVVSMGAILPFLAILTAPDLVFQHPIVAKLAGVWGINSGGQLVLPLAVAFVTAVLVAAAIRMLLLWCGTRLAYACGADLSIEAYRRTLYQPYRVHVARNSSEVISGITNKVGGAINVMSQSLALASSAVLLVVITLALIAVDPVVAVMATVGCGSCYALISWISRRQLRRNSQRIAYEQTQVVKALQEGLGGIRDVLLDGTQPVYCGVYRKADLTLRRAQGSNVFIAGSPRFVMEALGMVLIATLAYGFSREAGGLASALPTLGALAFGAQRLLPALQQSYGAWASIVGSHASLAATVELLDQGCPGRFGGEHRQRQEYDAGSADGAADSHRTGDSGRWPSDRRGSSQGVAADNRACPAKHFLGRYHPSREHRFRRHAEGDRPGPRATGSSSSADC